MRLKIVLAYEGTGWHGWQIQAPALALRTVQGQLEQALSRLAGARVSAFGSGRTDAGVHALGQTVHCDVADERFPKIRDWRHALNALLPPAIRVLSCEPCAGDFHARFSARAKTYRYRFWQEPGFVLPWLGPYVWRCGPLDKEPMRRALEALKGTHDFAGFANAGTPVKDTVRTIYQASLEEEPWDAVLAGAGPCLPPHRPCLRLDVTGSGFLKQMVRNIAGLLHDAGKGKLAPDEVPSFLQGRPRELLPSRTAPACGLTLIKVHYDGAFPGSPDPGQDAAAGQGGQA
ncbi:MAG: tRNA pseudouridine(38-40) synthase TruA [Desulfovibrio sp.]|nr:tRNA pseudouridine(38-40) synthase TruA [Desulfovibrio sp.]MBR5051247.1 tRNA pseudouridine(38-40) synthase TruA [Desulfovibrio sp.]